MITDKRVVKTRNAIKTAFMNIMCEKDISKISVSDIANKALINRSTFYLHYSDVNSVMTDIEREIELKITSCIDQFDASSTYQSTYSLFTNLSNTFYETETMKKFILYSTNSKSIIEKLKNIFVEKAVSSINPSIEGKRLDKYVYGITFITSGMVDTYLKWSYSESKNITLDELCKEVGEIAETMVTRLRIEAVTA
jgi:AcrR family transcriptional regulator